MNDNYLDASLSPEDDCSLIHLKNLSKIYSTSAGEFVALKNIDLCFRKGEFVSIMGKSGSGKSTLINMIAGIDYPTAGSVSIGGSELNRMSESDLAVWRGKTLGIVFQFFQLLPTLTILENIMLPMDFCNVFMPSEREEKAMEILKLLDISDLADELPTAVSGGHQQIAAIGRALSNDPPIVVADEPTGNLDSKTAERILNILEDLTRQDKTIIFVTHDTSLARWAQRQVLISDGELINEHLAKSLPMIPHNIMLEISKQFEHQSFLPGDMITDYKNNQAGLFLVTSGIVEVLNNGSYKPPKVVGLVHPDQHFSELEIERGKSSHISFRASGDSPVEVLWLKNKDFQKVVGNQVVNSALEGFFLERSWSCCSRQN